MGILSQNIDFSPIGQAGGQLANIGLGIGDMLGLTERAKVRAANDAKWNTAFADLASPGLGQITAPNAPTTPFAAIGSPQAPQGGPPGLPATDTPPPNAPAQPIAAAPQAAAPAPTYADGINMSNKDLVGIYRNPESPPDDKAMATTDRSLPSWRIPQATAPRFPKTTPFSSTRSRQASRSLATWSASLRTVGSAIGRARDYALLMAPAGSHAM